MKIEFIRANGFVYMRYHVIAIDFDGTLAWRESVSAETIEVLRKVKETGRKLALVTGREMADLERIFPEYKVFDYIVAENGALIYYPENSNEVLLGQPPPEGFIIELKNRGVKPISVGKVIVATWEPYETTALEIIKQSGIERQVIFNKGAVMILPPGINKATGLQSLLQSRNFSIHNTIAIGDAENDSAMLDVAEYSVAVNNALPALKQRADFVTTGIAGDGVRELLLKIMEDEHAEVSERLTRHYVHLGTINDNQDYRISPYRAGILLGGVSEGGKSTFAAAIAESLAAAGYQFCLVDPEGDYLNLPGTVVLGNDDTAPAAEEITELLRNPQQNLVICLLAVPMTDRPVFFGKLLKVLLEVRKTYGHPHWLLLDEAHHIITSQAMAEREIPLGGLANFILVTTSPDALNRTLLSQVKTVITVGDNERYIIEQFCEVTGYPAPVNIPRLATGEAGVWDIDSGREPYIVRYKPPDQLQQRHKRKYARGDMGNDSFIFTGPQNKLQLKANNLMMFIQMAEGIDDDTWLYHLQRSDYKNWALQSVKDASLADIIEKAENSYPDARATKKRIFDYIRENYTT